MTHQYAVEITLTRPASARELHRARHRITFAANADRSRLMTVQIDVLTTHYPDGHVRLNVVLSRRADVQIRRKAAASGSGPREVLRELIAADPAREQRERRHCLRSQLRRLLAHHTLEEVLTCAAGRLLQARPPA